VRRGDLTVNGNPLHCVGTVVGAQAECGEVGNLIRHTRELARGDAFGKAHTRLTEVAFTIEYEHGPR
jgi:hypothetical protein